MKKRLFIKNAVILTLTSIILRGVGILFRIYISNSIGSEGMGLYQLIFSIYTFASALACSGISIAVTRLVAEKITFGGKKAVNKILSYSLFLSVCLGLISCALMYFSADYISLHWLCDIRAAPSLKILSFGLPFMSISASLKGYFMARRKASTPSISQLFEQLIRIVVVILLLGRTDMSNLTKACKSIVWGNTLSEVGACLYVYIGLLVDRRHLDKGTQSPKGVMLSLAKIFMPVALSSYLNTILHTIENIIVPDALARHTLSREISLSQFGILKGMAMPLLFFPASFLGALSALLIPEITEYATNKKNTALNATINYTLLITTVSSILISAIFYIYSYEISYLIYKNNSVGMYLSILAPIIPFMYIESIIAGILNALNQQTALLRYNVYNSAIRITFIAYLVPKFGIYSLLAIIIASNLFTSLLNVKRLFSVTNARLDVVRLVIKPLIAIIISMLCLYFLAPLLQNLLKSRLIILIVSISILCAIYIFFILIFRCVTKKDMRPLLRQTRR